VTDATIQKTGRQTNCIPYYIKQVQLQGVISVNYTFMVLKSRPRKACFARYLSPYFIIGKSMLAASYQSISTYFAVNQGTFWVAPITVSYE
jgi:hypothetical protein